MIGMIGRRILASIAALLLCCSLASSGQLSLLGAGHAAGGGGGGAVTWDPVNIGANLSLSGGNLSVSTSSAGPWDTARSTTACSTAAYFEIHVTSWTSAFQILVGAVNSTASLNNFAGSDANGIGDTDFGQIFYNGANAYTGPSFGNGDYIGIAMDIPHGEIYWTKDGSTFLPAGGAAKPSGSSLYAALSLSSSAASATAAFSAASFHWSIPGTYAAWASC